MYLHRFYLLGIHVYFRFNFNLFPEKKSRKMFFVGQDPNGQQLSKQHTQIVVVFDKDTLIEKKKLAITSYFLCFLLFSIFLPSPHSSPLNPLPPVSFFIIDAIFKLFNSRYIILTFQNIINRHDSMLNNSNTRDNRYPSKTNPPPV